MLHLTEPILRAYTIVETMVALLTLACDPSGSARPRPFTRPVERTAEPTKHPVVAPTEERSATTPSDHPQKTTWWKRDSPCPAGSSLKGAAPPAGLEIWCENEQGRRNGLMTRWHHPTQRAAHGTMANDVPAGVFHSWYPNGTKESEISYANGRQSGPTKGWFKTGEPSWEGQYVANQRHGSWKVWTGDGTKEAGDYANGKRVGTWSVSSPSGHTKQVPASAFSPEK